MATPLIAVVGPTGTGKSSLAMRIAKEFDGEIIAADSRTVYTGMDIATAKPSKEDQAAVRHWCLDLVAPDEPFSVKDFQAAANLAIADIRSRGKIPLLVGGSGLYIDSVVYDLEFRPVDHAARATLEEMSEAALVSLAESTFQGVKLTTDTLGNRRRLIRALETGELGGSNYRGADRNVIMVGLDYDNDTLRQRIKHRIEEMVTEGLETEVRAARNQYEVQLPASSAIAYRAFAGYISGIADLEAAKQAFLEGDVKLAKKQRTWFRRDDNISWFSDPAGAYEFVRARLTCVS